MINSSSDSVHFIIQNSSSLAILMNKLELLNLEVSYGKSKFMIFLVFLTYDHSCKHLGAIIDHKLNYEVLSGIITEKFY